MVSCPPGRSTGHNSAFFIAHDGVVDLLWKNVNDINIDCDKKYNTFTCCNGSDCRDFNCPGDRPAHQEIENLKNAIIQYSRFGELASNVNDYSSGDSSSPGRASATGSVSSAAKTSASDTGSSAAKISVSEVPSSTNPSSSTENRNNAGSRLNMGSAFVLLLAISSLVSYA